MKHKIMLPVEIKSIRRNFDIGANQLCCLKCQKTFIFNPEFTQDSDFNFYSRFQQFAGSHAACLGVNVPLIKENDNGN